MKSDEIRSGKPDPNRLIDLAEEDLAEIEAVDEPGNEAARALYNSLPENLRDSPEGKQIAFAAGVAKTVAVIEGWKWLLGIK